MFLSYIIYLSIPIYQLLTWQNWVSFSISISMPHSVYFWELNGQGPGGYGFSVTEWSENNNLASWQHEIISTVLHYIKKYVLASISMKYEKSHKTDAPQHGISFPFLLDIFTKSLTLYHNSCIILMSCYFLYISLLSWCTFLKMTLIECQSPLKARDWGHALPCKTKKCLIKRLGNSSSSLPQRLPAWEKPSLPCKPHFHLKSSSP